MPSTQLRAIETAAKADFAPSPLTDHYVELLKIGLKTMTEGQAIGAWRTGVYLLGDATSYTRLASVWRSIFSGEHSFPEPIRVWDTQSAADLAVNWVLPDVDAAAAPGLYQRPFECQTLLTSSQLAAYVHLPEVETSGFAVNVVPAFDVVPPLVKADRKLSIGNVLQWAQPTQASYSVSPDSLARHVFVPGVTGGGKTNTIFHVLKQAWSLGIPFLVLEPAKAEYRTLLNDPHLRDALQVFTLGNETVSPFRVNPFEVVSWPRSSVGVHLDLLRSVFSASFGMWTPLPQVLEQCLHRVYKDRGWDITSNSNPRLDDQSDVAASFPTLSELVAKVDEVAMELGYEDKITADIHAALRTRLNALRAGGKGRMLDVQSSLPMDKLLEHPIVLELEGMGDDDDKAFVMGLLLIRLAEYRRAAGGDSSLKHLLVVEEAHRLLANVGTRVGEEQADPIGKAVATFTNLLSEIRAYGQGIIIADQVPTKLASDVIKNTNLKVAHKVVAADDREVLAGAMAMDPRQAFALATLTLGQAAVFVAEDDSPLLVQVPQEKGQEGELSPDDQTVKEKMDGLRKQLGYHPLLMPFRAYADIGPVTNLDDQAACDIVDDSAFQRTFARTVVSSIIDTSAWDRLWPDVLSLVQSKCPPRIDLKALMPCISIRAAHWFAGRRGAQAGWSYSESQQLADKLGKVLLAEPGPANRSPVRTDFQQYARELHARYFAPCPGCPHIYQHPSPICLFRYAATDLLSSVSLRNSWHAADAKERNSRDGRRRQTWTVCADAGYEMVEFPEAEWPEAMKQAGTEVARQAALCFAQQMLANDGSKLPRTGTIILNKLRREAGG